MIDIEFTLYEFKHVVYNWLQAKQSEAINTIEAGRVEREYSINSGRFLGLALTNKIELNVYRVCSYCTSSKHIFIIRQHG